MIYTTLNPEDTDSRLQRPAGMPDVDPTTVIPRWALPRPELADTVRLPMPKLPPREGLALAPWTPLPAVDLTRTEQFTLQPETYVGRHRCPDDEPAVGGWRSVLATAIARIRGAL